MMGIAGLGLKAPNLVYRNRTECAESYLIWTSPVFGLYHFSGLFQVRAERKEFLKRLFNGRECGL